MIPGAFQLAVAALRAEPEITGAFRSGAGVGWHTHDADVFAGCARFFRPSYAANLIGSWLPALEGVAAKLMAVEYPRSTMVGSDYHAESVEAARKRAAEEGLDGRPNALSQEGGYSLGAQAGEEPMRRIVTDAGFGSFRRVAETPFNIVYEARR